MATNQPEQGVWHPGSGLEYLRQDVAAAAELQRSVLPRMPMLRDYEFGLAFYGARDISGDHYDFIQRPDGSIGIAIADASGKGVTAAYLITLTRALLHAHPQADSLDPKALLSYINERLYRLIKRGLFVSMSYAILDVANHRLSVANAGHLPTLIWDSKAREILSLEATGVVLGAGNPSIFDPRLEVQDVELEIGDRVVFLTDGVNEAMSPGQKEFGLDNLKKRLVADSDRTSAEFIKYLMAQIDKHCAGNPQSDDITMVTFRRKFPAPGTDRFKVSDLTAR